MEQTHAREVAKARLLGEQRARLAVRLCHHGLGEVDLPKADLVLFVERGVYVHAGVVLARRRHLNVRRLVCTHCRPPTSPFLASPLSGSSSSATAKTLGSTEPAVRLGVWLVGRDGRYRVVGGWLTSEVGCERPSSSRWVSRLWHRLEDAGITRSRRPTSTATVESVRSSCPNPTHVPWPPRSPRIGSNRAAEHGLWVVLRMRAGGTCAVGSCVTTPPSAEPQAPARES